MCARSVKQDPLQEYLQFVASVSSESDHERLALIALSSMAELRFKMRGGSKCTICRAHVRHVVPVVARRDDGTELKYSCLCTRCLEAEKAVSEAVTLRLGDAEVVFQNAKAAAAGKR